MENQINMLYHVMFQGYPDVVNVPQLCEMLGGISDKTAYRLLRSGKIRSLLVGKKYLIPKPYVIDYLIGDTAKSLA